MLPGIADHHWWSFFRLVSKRIREWIDACPPWRQLERVCRFPFLECCRDTIPINRSSKLGKVCIPIPQMPFSITFSAFSCLVYVNPKWLNHLRHERHDETFCNLLEYHVSSRWWLKAVFQLVFRFESSTIYQSFELSCSSKQFCCLIARLTATAS